MAWSLRSECGTAAFQTLEELRSQLRADAEEDASVSAEREFCVSVADEVCASTAMDARESTPRKRAPRRDAKLKAAPKKRPARRKRDESDEEAEVTIEVSTTCEPTAPPPGGTEENDETENDENEEPVDAPTMQESDLALAASTLVRDMKAICARVSALATVLEDVQASAVNRCFSALVRELESLQLLAYGGSQSVKKKTTRKRTVRV